MRLVASLDKLGDHCRGGGEGGDETGEEGREEREKKDRGEKGNGGERVVQSFVSQLTQYAPLMSSMAASLKVR